MLAFAQQFAMAAQILTARQATCYRHWALRSVDVLACPVVTLSSVNAP